MRLLSLTVLGLVLATGCQLNKPSNARLQSESSDESIVKNAETQKIEQFIWLANSQFRIAEKIEPVLYDADVSYVARDWSAQQAVVNALGHKGFPEERSKVLAEVFPNKSVVFRAENVAFVDSSQMSVKATPQAIAKRFHEYWESSAGHRANLKGKYDAAAVGVVKKGDIYYGTIIFFNDKK